MPTSIPIQAIPNQNFSINLDNNLFDITLRTTNGITSASFTINGTDTIDNIRCVAGSVLIPYAYLEAGNFMFLTNNYQFPIYTQFNISQTLVYFTAAELATIRDPYSLPITAADFNPLGALPLRFAPQGYVKAT